ncbi:3-deoxy-D-manno-octulosonic acid transferase [Falsigemmobacter faecalis]|uniref:3-deoxy-D-manno-octulosonic acid transferase n=1 Tax=Falsigemmobacter faecalis TaxID=2488730 RepID=A0A3P3DAZ0_9RHOB|nr:glycosyltransferase N-terminal domain-containing protein [Falsigemmobacter faecalis]RRH71507.1 3-deoxy-D-manno-octulosonic acid transferase [Falsigemmobacter faecalis]
MSLQLQAYLAASRLLPLVAPKLLARRLAKGKEEAARWREKLGEPTLPRPDAPVIWLHAVGVGEVLALRGLIVQLADLRPDVEFLVTSTARSSAEVMGGQLPRRTRHQFLPVDAPQYLAKFLDHWKPSLSIWAEQDLWPGAVVAADRAGIPLAMVNARMNDAAFARREKAKSLYGNLLKRFRLITAQDAVTAANLKKLGAQAVEVTGSLKSAAPPLAADKNALELARVALEGRRPWLLASSHQTDEAIALKAQVQLHAGDPAQLLVIAPRDPQRASEIAAAARAMGLTVAQRSKGEGPGQAAVWIADTFGELGLWYRLIPVALIGGTFCRIEGHNPWEPLALGAAVLHGPRTANFAADFAQLDVSGAALPVTEGNLLAALQADHMPQRSRASQIVHAARGSLRPLARDLLDLVA